MGPDSEMAGKKLVSFGLVGCGRIGASGDERAAQWPTAHLWLPYSHAAAIAQCDVATLRAVCDVREEAARTTAESHGAKFVYTDVGAMLTSERLDVLAIATRTQERVAILEEAIARGIRGIYCEKPLNNSLEAADHVRALVEKHRVGFSYGVKRRFMQVHELARDLLRAGEIGTLQTVTLRLGGGLLMWTQPHAMDLACFYASDDEVESVQADLDLDPGAIRSGVIDADPMVRMSCIRFKNGIVAHVIPGGTFDVELVGTRGVLSIRNDGLESVTRHAVAGSGLFLGEKRVPTWEKSSGTATAIRRLALAVRDGTDPGYGIAHAVRNLEILFACVYSQLDGGRRVSFPIERRGFVITGRHGELLV